MAEIKISDLTELTQVASGDYLAIDDVSDLSQAPTGSTRKIKYQNIGPFTFILTPTGGDDSTLIQGALNSIHALGGGVLHLNGILFQHASQLTIYSNTILKGNGIGITSLKKIAQSNIDQIVNADSINGNTDIAVCDLTIDGNKANQTTSGSWGRGVKFTKVTRPLVKDVELLNCDNRGVDYNQCIDGWIMDSYGKDCGVFQEQTFTIQSSTRCYFKNIISSGGKDRDFIIAYSTDCGLFDCISYSALGAGLSLFGSVAGGNNTGIIIDGLIIVTPLTEGIYIERTLNFSLLNILIDTPGDEGIRNYGTVSIIVDAIFQNIQIINPGANGILCDADRAVYSNIKITNAGSEGMRILGPESRLTNCHVYGAGDNCFRISGQDTGLVNCIGKNGGKLAVANHKNGIRIEATGVQVIGGRYFDDQNTPTQQYGIAEFSPANNSIITGNDVRNNVTAGILKAGANSIIRNNQGYVTEASGTATINSGATSVVVTHGLSVTPTLNNISVSIGANPTNDPGNLYIDTFTSTQFTIHSRNDPGASNLSLAWRVIVL